MQAPQSATAHPEKEEPEVFQSLYQQCQGRFVVLRDGRISGFGQPEPEFLRRRYEHAQALREIKRETRIKQALADESTGFVERIRTALGIA
jgi:hypothetical protein